MSKKNNVIFRKFYDKYQEYRSRKISKSSLLTLDTLKAKYLVDLSEKTINEIFVSKSLAKIYNLIIKRNDLSQKYKNRLIGEIRFICDFANKMDYVSSTLIIKTKNVLENVKVTTNLKEKSFYTKDQLKSFINSIEDETDKDMFILFTYLGARLSEFIGLTWDCYDEIEKTIKIKQQIIYLKEGKPILSNQLKTKESYRICKLNDECNSILLKRKEKSSKGFIFPKSISNPNVPLPKTNFRLKLKKYIEKANLPLVTPHSFRHAKATLLMSVCLSMADVKAAARFLGHSVTMMMETYAHEDQKNTDLIFSRLDKIFL